MERKFFLRKGVMAALGATTIIPLINACQKTSTIDSIEPDINARLAACKTTPKEMEGPFPNKVPSSLVKSDIRADRKGIPLAISITVNSAQKKCAALAGAIVDIWQCDANGNYSEYEKFSAVHFLRGRQVTNANGQVSFNSIFPGWYPGRAPHIHVHVYDANGKSLLVTQVAFPTNVCDTVYTTATSLYKKGKQQTQNSEDISFADSLAGDLATVTGSISGGYSLKHIITVR